MSGDFTYVSRTRKSRKNKNHKPEDSSLTSLEDRFNTTQLQFLVSDFCARCLNAFQEVLKLVPRPERIVCLGLGSLVDGEARGKRISEVQLALLTELDKLFDVQIVAYDPVFTELDIEFLKTLNIQVETLTDDHYDSTSIRTLFYLPHCDRSTNESVISNLLSTSSLSNAILLGNDLRNYSNILTDAQFKNLAPSIFKLVKYEMLEWRNLEPKHGEEYWDAFSDLCLMWPKEKPISEEILPDNN